MSSTSLQSSSISGRHGPTPGSVRRWMVCTPKCRRFPKGRSIGAVSQVSRRRRSFRRRRVPPGVPGRSGALGAPLRQPRAVRTAGQGDWLVIAIFAVARRVVNDLPVSRKVAADRLHDLLEKVDGKAGRRGDTRTPRSATGATNRGAGSIRERSGRFTKLEKHLPAPLGVKNRVAQ